MDTKAYIFVGKVKLLLVSSSAIVETAYNEVPSEFFYPSTAHPPVSCQYGIFVLQRGTTTSSVVTKLLYDGYVAGKNVERGIDNAMPCLYDKQRIHAPSAEITLCVSFTSSRSFSTSWD